MTRSHLLAAALGVLLGVLLSLFVVAGAASRSAAHPGVSVPSWADAGERRTGAPLGSHRVQSQPEGRAGEARGARCVDHAFTASCGFDSRPSGVPSPAISVLSAGDGPTHRPQIGIASRYWGSRGWHGVPHVALPGARWSPTTPWGWARVCVVATGLCDVFPVVDRCGCAVGDSRRIVDLSAEAVAELGLEPARGLYRVTIEVWRTP